MLELKNITKIYHLKYLNTLALSNINISFSKGEFICILGPSGCGKSTLLNIIGGLDTYTSGEILISNKSTKNFTSEDFDAYRNNKIGFIFQSYNLIEHMSVLENIRLTLSLNGITRKESKRRALEALQKVNLKSHANKYPSQLSGGERQRVAIARAIIRNADIILADEPTGALDSKNSNEIMNLIKEIFKDQLVIIVTHNHEIAYEYATRVIKMNDCKIISDTNPKTNDSALSYQTAKTSLKFTSALKLSLSNLLTKFKRTLITIFACSIGIIGLAYSKGMEEGVVQKLTSMANESSEVMPISIPFIYQKEKQVKGLEEIYLAELNEYQTNYIDEDFVRFLQEDKMNLLIDSLNIDYSNRIICGVSSNFEEYIFNEIDYYSLPDKKILNHSATLVSSNSHVPEGANYITIVLDKKLKMDYWTKKLLNLSENYTLEEIYQKEIYYLKSNQFFDTFMSNYYDRNSIQANAEKAKKSVKDKQAERIFVKEIYVVNEESKYPLANGIYLEEEFIKTCYLDNANSNPAQLQRQFPLKSLIDWKKLNNEYEFEIELGRTHGSNRPLHINLSSKYENRSTLIKEIKNYFSMQNIDIYLVDTLEIYKEDYSQTINLASVLLSLFSYIAIAIAVIMLSIIINISVKERTHEIGILRSIGARTKDIRRIFYAESFIYGLSAGLLGVIAFGVTFPYINKIVSKNSPDYQDVIRFSIHNSIIIISTTLIFIMISSIIPAIYASRKKPIDALRSE